MSRNATWVISICAKFELDMTYAYYVSKNATCGRGEGKKKRTETFMHQAGYLPRPPTST